MVFKQYFFRYREKVRVICTNDSNYKYKYKKISSISILFVLSRKAIWKIENSV